MASLTDQLSTDMSVKPVRQAPSPSTGLATALNALSKGIDVVDSSLRQGRQDKRQREEDAFKAQERARKEQERKMPYLAELAYREAEVDSQGRLVDQNIAVPSSPVAFDGDLAGKQVFDTTSSPFTGQAAADAGRAVADLNNVQLAVTQKRMPAISFNSALNKRFMELINKYPEQTETIRKYLNDNGLNPSLARTALDEQSGHDNVREHNEDWGNKMYDVGTASLDPALLPNMTREEVIAQGAKVTNTQFRLEQATKQADLALKNQNLSDAQKKAAEDERDDSINEVTVNEAWNNSGPIMSALQKGVAAISKLPVGQQQAAFDQLAPQYDQWAQNYKAKALAQASANGMTDPAKLTALGTTIDVMVERGRSLWSGDMSVAASNRRALDSVTNQLKLDVAQSMPVFFALQNMGMKADEIAGYTEALAGNVELQQALSKEMKGFTAEFGRKSASTRLMEIVSILKGQKGLEDFTPEEARKMMPTLFKTSDNYVNMYGTGRGDVSGDTMLNALGEVITAARTVSPATASTSSIKFATAGVASNAVRTALKKALKDPILNDQAEATIAGSRAASAQILLAMKSPKTLASYDTRYWKIGIDKETGRAKAIPTGAKPLLRQSAVGGYAEARGGDSGLGARPETVPTKPPAELQKWADYYNVNLTNISDMNTLDPNGIKGATPLEVAKYYSLGTVPKALQVEKQKSANPQKEIDNILGTIEDAFNGVADMNTPIQLSGKSRGERNNNPGNLEAGPYTRRQPGFKGSDGRFAIFDTPENGQKAQENLLAKSYLDKGHNTPSKVIWRYGNDPGAEDDVAVKNYVNYVSKKLGIGPNEVIPRERVGDLARYMREFETGNRS